MTHPNAKRPSGRPTALDAVHELLDHGEERSERGRDLVALIRRELERGEEELREVRDKYQALVEQIPAIVYVDVADESMVTTYVSPQIEALLGITPQEYIDDPQMWTRHLHPDDRERALATYEAGREAGKPFTFEYRLVGRDGRVVWFRDSAVVLRDQIGIAAHAQRLVTSRHFHLVRGLDLERGGTVAHRMVVDASNGREITQLGMADGGGRRTWNAGHEPRTGTKGEKNRQGS